MLASWGTETATHTVLALVTLMCPLSRMITPSRRGGISLMTVFHTQTLAPMGRGAGGGARTQDTRKCGRRRKTRKGGKRRESISLGKQDTDAFNVVNAEGRQPDRAATLKTKKGKVKRTKGGKSVEQRERVNEVNTAVASVGLCVCQVPANRWCLLHGGHPHPLRAQRELRTPSGAHSHPPPMDMPAKENNTHTHTHTHTHTCTHAFKHDTPIPFSPSQFRYLCDA